MYITRNVPHIFASGTKLYEPLNLAFLSISFWNLCSFCTFRGPEGLRWLGGRRLFFLHYVGRRLLPDVCRYPVSRIASVDVSSDGDVFCLPSLANHLFLPNSWGLATMTKLKTDMRICRTIFRIVTLVFYLKRANKNVAFLNVLSVHSVKS